MALSEAQGRSGAIAVAQLLEGSNFSAFVESAARNAYVTITTIDRSSDTKWDLETYRQFPGLAPTGPTRLVINRVTGAIDVDQLYYESEDRTDWIRTVAAGNCRKSDATRLRF